MHSKPGVIHQEDSPPKDADTEAAPAASGPVHVLPDRSIKCETDAVHRQTKIAFIFMQFVERQ